MPVTVYAEKNYGGASAVLEVGRHSGVNLGVVGVDNIASVKVPAGLEVMLYEEDNLGGKRRSFNQDTPDLGDFNDAASSAEIRNLPPVSLSLDPQGRYLVVGMVDDNDLKYRIASDPTTISRLADLADILGYAWCGGTDYQYVGQGFDVIRSGDAYVLQARFRQGDRYLQGPYETNRLKITLSNFRVLIDPSTMKYAQPLVQDMTPQHISTLVASNANDTTDSASIGFSYQLSTTTTHTTTFSFTEGFKINLSKKWSVDGIFAKAEYTVGFEFNFSATQGWSDATATMEGQTLPFSQTVQVPAKSKRSVSLVAAAIHAEVNYTTEAVIGFDIAFDGFLKWQGNGHKDHPTDRPNHHGTFGSQTFTGPQHIADLYDHRQINGYSEWDWGWVEEKFGDRLRVAMEFVRRPIVVSLSGKFSGVKGTSVTIQAGPAVPLTDTVTLPPVNTKVGKATPTPVTSTNINTNPNTTTPTPTDRRRWEQVPFDSTAADIAIGVDGMAWAVAIDGFIYRRAAANGQWARIPEVQASRVAVDATGVGWIVNRGGGVNRIVSAGGAPTVLPPGDAVTPSIDNATDISAGANGTPWIVAGADSGGNRPVARWNQTGWETANGAAVAIAVAPDGTPWICDASGQVSALINGVWTQKAVGAKEIAWSAGAAPVLWAIDPQAAADGAAVRKWTGTAWEPAPVGSAVRLAAGPDGLPWKIDGKGAIYRLVNG